MVACAASWTRDLQFHPHLHCIVTAGGLSADGSRWVPGSPRFLFPVKALSSVFRGKFLDGLQQLFHQGHLPSLGALELSLLLASARAQPWVVYAKRPFGGTKALFSYLGRYTHRTGISNQRLLSVSDAAVTFRTRGKKTCTLAPFEFLRRFLLHVLPPRFTTRSTMCPTVYQEMWSSFVTAVLSIVLATQATKSSKSVVKRA